MLRKIMLVACGAGLLLSGLVLTGRWLDRNEGTPEERAIRVLQQLTPELAIARCGRPLQDQTLSSQPPFFSRTLVFEGPQGTAIRVFFTRLSEQGSPWSIGMSSGFGSAYDTAESKLAALPCLGR